MNLDYYAKDGFIFPIEVVSSTEAKKLRNDLEESEAELAKDKEKLALLHSYPDRLLPSFDCLIRNKNLLKEVQKILGPNLMVWSSGLFIKEANSSKVVSWHQDLTYWGLTDADEVTAWVALSPSNKASGCMRFIPSSHKKNLVPHTDTFSENNLLTRGQEIAVQVDESQGVDIILKAGQASLHHGHLFHSSGPNTTNNRRIGAAIRYIKPSMQQQNGDKSLVALVKGKDTHGHFLVANSPVDKLKEQDFLACKADSEMKQQILYKGAAKTVGTRYQKK